MQREVGRFFSSRLFSFREKDEEKVGGTENKNEEKERDRRKDLKGGESE